MELVRIPTTVSTENKDLFSKLPDEVLIEILKETLRANQAEMGSAVHRFNLHDVQFHKLCRINKQFARLFPTAFYEACKFDITPFEKAAIALRPFVIPPFIHRQFLRRLQVEFLLRDSFFVISPFTYSKKYFQLTNVRELEFCDDARRLRDLTTKDHDKIERTLAVYEAAGITVYARKVTITAAPGFPTLDYLLPTAANLASYVAKLQVWHDRLVAAITIKDIVAEPEN